MEKQLEMSKNTKTIKAVLSSAIPLAIFAALYCLSLYNIILPQFIMEVASIVFGVCIFILAISTNYLAKNSFMVLLATVFLAASVFDFLKILSYQGLDLFGGFVTNLFAQLWVASMLFQTAGIFAAAFFIEKVLTKKGTVIISILFPLLLIVIILNIFVFKIFPLSFVEGLSSDLTNNIFEYLIITLALGSIIVYTIKRKKIGRRNYFFIILSLSLVILSELAVTVYMDSFGVLNLLGHYFKLASFYFILRFFIETNIRDPFAILFNNLKGTSEQLQFVSTHDNVTGFLNRSSVFEELKKQFEIAKRFEKQFSIIMIDIDDFTKINDNFGHPAGDKALSFLSDIIRNSLRDVDIKGRYSGDLFIIAPLEVDSSNAIAIAQKIQDNLSTSLPQEDTPFGKFQISIGVSGIRANRTLDEILQKAEKALLKSKESGKHRVTLN